MNNTTILLADDHRIVREGIARLLESFGDIEIVGQANDGYEAVTLATQLQPDILVLDITMPKLLGVEVISDVRIHSPGTKIIVLSMHHKDKYIKDCMRNGASAYLLKESAVNELKSAIQYVLKDQIYLSPAISRSVVKDWLTPDSNHNGSPLTSREREILKLLAEGYSNKEIASMLFISPKTVETHRHRINDKLNLGNVADLVRYALKEGLISVE
ncbi:DNA-binding response regulator [candidate division KSB1 bacterium]|nr:response regulator transcription factor [candidate division KSB1 bacterium]RQW05995.1 MAG: DNA-binding response regulator [candidate division KSB1 bacterium]